MYYYLCSVSGALKEEVTFMADKTIKFKIQGERDSQIKTMLSQVYDALEEKGYNPVSQIVGYILSEDPAYITTYNNARNTIMKIDRYELLQALIKDYLGVDG